MDMCVGMCLERGRKVHVMHLEKNSCVYVGVLFRVSNIDRKGGRFISCS